MTILDSPTDDSATVSTGATLQSDTLRLLFTYGIALIVVIGGGIMLVSTVGNPDAKDLSVIAAGFIGSALTFVFGQETSARTARQAANVQSIANRNPTNGGSSPTS